MGVGVFSGVHPNLGSLYLQPKEQVFIYMMTVSVWRAYERRGRCLEAGLGVPLVRLAGRYSGPEGALILAVGVRPAHLEGGR